MISDNIIIKNMVLDNNLCSNNRVNNGSGCGIGCFKEMI